MPIEPYKKGADLIKLRLRYKKSPKWHIYTNGSWLTAPQDLHQELFKFIRYVYIPLRRDYEASGWGQDGLLKTVVQTWLSKLTSIKRHNYS